MKKPTFSNNVLRLALFGLATWAATIAHADIFEVDTTEDLPDDGFTLTTCHTAAGTCSLRAAIMKANQIDGPSSVSVPAGIYVLTIPPTGFDGDDTGDLNLPSPAADQAIIIRGAGAASTIIDGNSADGVFTIGAGRRAFIEDLTIRNGVRNSGGGIANAGQLIITHAVIEGNFGVYGAGIYNGGMLFVVGSTVRSNIAVNLGGGLYLEGSASVRDSAIYGNGALFGGGIDVASFSPSLYVVNSTISGNYANTNGGGISSDGATFLYNTSVIDNDADHDRDETGGIGGGIYANPGSIFVAVNALIARNTILDAPIYDNCNGTVEVYGMNLFDEIEGCVFTGNGSGSSGFVSAATIGSLQDNGGPTWTQALLAGSEAIDNTIDSLGCVDETGATLTSDQRGAPRVAGAHCDVGAFEYGAFVDLIFQDDFD